MSRPRPVARDTLPESGSPIVARHCTPEDLDRPRRAPTTHDYAVLAYCTGGTSRMEQDGEWRLREGEVLVVPAGSRHRTLERRRLEHWGLSFSTPSLVAGGDASLLDPIERVRDGASAIVSIPASRQAHLESLFRELASPEHESRHHDAVRRSLLTLVLAELGRASGASASTIAPATRGRGVVGEALRFIERHCLGRLTVDDVAAAVGRTPTHVTTALTRATGRSAVQWIVSGRMAEARRLLMHSDERVDVIAGRVGYADPTHFIRMFRREHGVTPAAFRAARAR